MERMDVQMGKQRESPDPAGPSIVIPDGFALYSENNAHILIQSKDEAFLNPVQEFNRDLSVACIRMYSEELNREKEEKFKKAEERRAKRVGDATWVDPTVETKGEPSQSTDVTADGSGEAVDVLEGHKKEYVPHKIIVLEALSATGLRSIRYAKEIPLIRFVFANDLDPSATAAMKRNVEINKLGPRYEEPTNPGEEPKMIWPGKVRVKQGDACDLLYHHRPEKARVDVVDLDPYGTAAPFIDAAVQSLNPGGLLCVTCTDMSVLATTNYSEKCFSNYGGIPVKGEYTHEAALRLVLHTIATSAGRYGRYIEPLLSLSIDFYVRVFVRVHEAPVEVKKIASKTSTFYICSGCSSWHEQKLGRIAERTNEYSGAVSLQYKTAIGPPVSSQCPECGFGMHLAGPMWSGPLHNPDFVSKVLDHVKAKSRNYQTSSRMTGMLTIAQQELDTPFYFTPARIAGNFHCTTPALGDVTSALLNADYKVSRSHACAGSIKTNAPREVIHDIFRTWAQKYPVRMDRVSETSPTAKLLSKEIKTAISFKRHPNSVSRVDDVKIVRYQQNPAPNWGPGSRAGGKKRKRDGDF